jgi:hypothetical protein
VGVPSQNGKLVLQTEALALFALTHYQTGESTDGISSKNQEVLTFRREIAACQVSWKKNCGMAWTETTSTITVWKSDSTRYLGVKENM